MRCDDLAHLWRPNPDATLLDDPSLPDFVCDNCPAEGMDCPNCDGLSYDDDEPEADCLVCDGSGVLARPVAATWIDG